MRHWAQLLSLLLASVPGAVGQSALPFPATVNAGVAFSVPTEGLGPASLYIVGPGNTIRSKIQLGETVALGPEDLCAAGRYAVFLVEGTGTQELEFTVAPSRKIATLSFLAKPSRLQVNVPNGLSGVVYVFDVFRNLVLQPQPVSFEIADAAGRAESRSATTSNGVAWVKMNSAAKAGAAQFQAAVGNVREKRVVQQVPGDPCGI